jgi:uncharacterized protein with HEPN domain
MSSLPREFLEHIRDEAEYLVGETRGLTRELFTTDETRRRAFVRSLEVIGEAVKHLPEEFRIREPDIDWRAIAGMRDRLIHGYFGVDYEIVWDAVTTKVPTLLESVRRMLSDVDDTR